MNLMKKLVPLLGGRHQLGLPGIRHYLAWRYPQVNSDLRFRGWMTDILVDFKKPEDLKGSAKSVLCSHSLHEPSRT